jgi:quercetin dioxygenase-like cupin family protein
MSASAHLVSRVDSQELLGDAARHIKLVADGTDTGGALSTIKVRLDRGDPGATPHRHQLCTETFYVLSGTVVILAGADLIEASTGDQVVVPPGTDHAFAAPARTGCELLVIFTPGVDRFDYFRTLIDVQAGRLPPQRLHEIAAHHDTYFRSNPCWDTRPAGRMAATPGSDRCPARRS